MGYITAAQGKLYTYRALDFEPRTFPVMHIYESTYTSRQWLTPRRHSVSFDPSFADPGHPCVAGFATSSGLVSREAKLDKHGGSNVMMSC